MAPPSSSAITATIQNPGEGRQLRLMRVPPATDREAGARRTARPPRQSRIRAMAASCGSCGFLLRQTVKLAPGGVRSPRQSRIRARAASCGSCGFLLRHGAMPAPVEQAEHGGDEDERGNGGAEEAADDRAAERRVLLTAVAQTESHGN